LSTARGSSAISDRTGKIVRGQYTLCLPLLSGESDAPPEGAGDPGGFAEFFEIIGDPEHEDYEHMVA